MPLKNTTKKTGGITPKAFKVALGACVKKLRKSHQMTQTAFGKEIDLAYYQISRYERGEDELSLYIAMRICKVFGVSIEDFLEDLEDFDDISGRGAATRP